MNDTNSTKNQTDPASVLAEMRDRESPVRVRYPERLDAWADALEAAIRERDEEIARQRHPI